MKIQELLLPPEQPKKEIIISPNIIRPFGRGLRQLTAGALREIDDNVAKLEPTIALESETYIDIQRLKEASDQFRGFLTDLETAKEVKLVNDSSSDWPLWVIVISKERDDEIQPAAGEVAVDSSIINQFSRGLNDSGNYTVIINGFAQLLHRGCKTATTADIEKASDELTLILDIFGPDKKLDKIRIITDDKGNVTLIPVPLEKPKKD